MAWLENRLSRGDAGVLQQHLEHCADCRRLAGEFRETESLIAHDRGLQPNPFVSTRIMQHLDAHLHTKKSRPLELLVRLVQPAILSAALAIAVLAGIYLGRHETRQYSEATRRPENIREMQASFFISDLTTEDQAVSLEP